MRISYKTYKNKWKWLKHIGVWGSLTGAVSLISILQAESKSTFGLNAKGESYKIESMIVLFVSIIILVFGHFKNKSVAVEDRRSFILKNIKESNVSDEEKEAYIAKLNAMDDDEVLGK